MLVLLWNEAKAQRGWKNRMKLKEKRNYGARERKICGMGPACASEKVQQVLP